MRWNGYMLGRWLPEAHTSSTVKMTQQFGFLNCAEEIQFENRWVRPLPEFSGGLEYMKEYGNRDGYIYPPTIKTVVMNSDTGDEGEEIANSERPASVFTLPMSHELVLSDPVGHDDLRHQDAGLLVHVLAFLFGTRLQFSGWRFDGRVPTTPTNSFILNDGVPGHYLSWVYTKWKSWLPDLRRRYINIVYMHGRASSYVWEWDRFMYQYMVFDAIYRFHCLNGGRVFNGHKNRLFGLCHEYGIPENVDVLNKMYDLRNKLFHEALWNNQTPGQGSSDARLIEKWLAKMNDQLIVAITGYKNKFTGRGWWSFGWRPFDKYE
jgi:hypothetical protein